ncbi:heme biosynthesis protein HemY [Magnetospirillum sp. SS-4]|uniref:heme biosynthesis protein HemY n=1 Tax=Magnetospirillum sp. SS-4 TaxID=2681465 RepID=UPI001382195B|nr:heme biosynthesis HemY N-terminal domain-containing protein [Magnetospirillum sp. SS-4]CAA7621282.1 Putative protoheme IX synthesis protein -Conserved among Magnetospirillum sp [Magnetospirillum sp. SS-4]
MRRLLAFLLLSALAVAGAVWLADRPGEVTIHWQGWRLDTTVPVLLATVALLTVLLSLLGRVLRLVVGGPGRMLAARRTRLTRKGYVALSDGLAAVASGDSRQATRLARKADKLLKDQAVTGLLTVRAAEISGDPATLRARYETMTERPETAYLGFKGLMDLALRQGDRDAARAHATRALALQPGAEGLAGVLFDLQMEAGLLAEAELTLGIARRHSVLPSAELAHRRALVLFARAEAAEKSGDAAAALALALDSRDAEPSFVPAVAMAARLHRAKGKPRKAESLIRSTFRVAPHPLLTAEWAALGQADSPLDRVKRMRILAEDNPAAACGHVALAEAALAARLWGQARTHLEKALEQQPSRHVLALLAQLERDERKDEAAALAWLARSGDAGTGPAWTCGGCGRTAPAFSVACPACHAPGRMEWR